MNYKGQVCSSPCQLHISQKCPEAVVKQTNLSPCFSNLNSLSLKEAFYELLDRAISSRFESNEHSQPLQSSENGARHVERCNRIFDSKDQATALQSSEKRLQHTRAKFDTSITKALKQDLEQDKEAF